MPESRVGNESLDTLSCFYLRHLQSGSQKWYTFCFQNCSDLLLEKIVLGIEEKHFKFVKKIEITRTIYSKSKRSEQFLKQNVFLTCSSRFLRPNLLEQFKFKLEKCIGI